MFVLSVLIETAGEKRRETEGIMGFIEVGMFYTHFSKRKQIFKKSATRLIFHILLSLFTELRMLPFFVYAKYKCGS